MYKSQASTKSAKNAWGNSIKSANKSLQKLRTIKRYVQNWSNNDQNMRTTTGGIGGAANAAAASTTADDATADDATAATLTLVSGNNSPGHSTTSTISPARELVLPSLHTVVSSPGVPPAPAVPGEPRARRQRCGGE